jgi:UDPglucose 6-dehydrogenase
MVVIGCDNPKYGEVIRGLYQGRYKYIEPIVTDTITAEMIKLVLNNFFSLKVGFGNEMHDYAQKAGANYEVVKKALETAPWGSKNHWEVYYKGKRGIHGHCLPKDLEAFATYTGSLILKAVRDVNSKYE